MRYIKALFFLSLLILPACYQIPTRSGYQYQMQFWNGQSVDQLISSWGPPTTEYPLTNGGRVLQYEKVRKVRVNNSSRHTFHHGMLDPDPFSDDVTVIVDMPEQPVYEERKCITRFTVDPNHIILYSNFEGRDCKDYGPSSS